MSFQNVISSNKPLANVIANEEMDHGIHSLEEANNLIILHEVAIASLKNFWKKLIFRV